MMEDPHHSELVRRSVSIVYPEGDAALAWQALANRYEPRNGIGQQTLITELFASTSENGSKDPGIWVFELQRMQYELNAMGATLSVTMLMGRILSKFPLEYESVADNLARQENKTIASVSLVLTDKQDRLRRQESLDQPKRLFLSDTRNSQETADIVARKATRQQIVPRKGMHLRRIMMRRTTVVYVERTTTKLRSVIIERKKAVTMRPTTITKTDSRVRVNSRPKSL
jgi:hypothetical protein